MSANKLCPKQKVTQISSAKQATAQCHSEDLSLALPHMLPAGNQPRTPQEAWAFNHLPSQYDTAFAGAEEVCGDAKSHKPKGCDSRDLHAVRHSYTSQNDHKTATDVNYGWETHGASTASGSYNPSSGSLYPLTFEMVHTKIRVSLAIYYIYVSKYRCKRDTIIGRNKQWLRSDRSKSRANIVNI